MEREGKARPHASDVDSVHNFLVRRAGERTAEQIHIVALRRDSAENLVQMQLSATGMRIVPILPVHDKDAQGLEHALLTGIRVEHTVYEPGALRTAVTFCQSDRLLDDHSRRRGALQQLGDGQPQH